MTANQLLAGGKDTEMKDEGPMILENKKRVIQGYFKTKRTDKVFEVAVPDAQVLSELACKPLILECAAEFHNFIQMALEGVKFCRLVREPGCNTI